MGFVILPLCQSPLTLRRVFLLIKQLVEDLHRLLIRDDALTVELVFSVPEPDHIF